MDEPVTYDVSLAEDYLPKIKVNGVSLQGLVADELTVHAIGMRERLTIEGPDILLQPAAARTLGLAFHELATNVVKFGTLVL